MYIYIYLYISNFITTFAYLLTEFSILIGWTNSFSCILIGQFRFRFLFLFRNSESVLLVAIFLVHVSSGRRLVLYGCRSVVAIFWNLSGLFICIGYR